MKFITVFLAFVGITTAALNTTREYQLQTQLKPSSKNKKGKAGLWLFSYHTGAGLGDATLDHRETGTVKGFLNETNGALNNQLFDLGNEFPWYLEMAENTAFYAGWQPVRLNAGSGGNSTTASGFFINSTGLQWTTTPASPGSAGDVFAGWLVCDWWHGAPQLFFRVYDYNTPAPASCADVNLIPHYL